jgi:hypothetical protein
MTTALKNATVLNKVLERLGTARALEAAETHMTPESSKMGVWDDGHPVVGVDFTGGKFRARIRFCDALTGLDVRVTLIRTDFLDEAVWAYRYAHIVLWGSASWAADDDIIDEIRKVRSR